MTDKVFKKAEMAKLARLFNDGELNEVETRYQVLEKNGKKFTQVKMTFKVDMKGIIEHLLPDNCID